MSEVITSAANPLVKRVRLLADRKHRRREAAFVVQGIQPVWQAVEAGADARGHSSSRPDLLRHPGALAMVAAQEAAGVRVARVSGELFSRIADRDGPSGLAAIVRGRAASLADLAGRSGRAVRRAARAGNPGNVGTIIRTASAAGAAGVILIGPSADPRRPGRGEGQHGRAVRGAGRGGGVGGRVPGLGAPARRHGRRRLGAGQRLVLGGRPADCRWPSCSAARAPGCPTDLLDAADLRVAIPMTGTAESLNLAVAAGVLLYEVRRRTGLAGPLTPGRHRANDTGPRPGRDGSAQAADSAAASRQARGGSTA